MENYEKTIGLKTIWLTIIRRFPLIFIIFIPMGLASIIVTQFLLTKTYQSTVTMSRGVGTTISTAQHTVMQSYIRDSSVNAEDHTKDGAVAKAVTKLEAEGIVITANEINKGLAFASMTNGATSFSFSFTSNNSTLVQPVLKAVSEAAVENMAAGTAAEYKTAKIESAASGAVKNSKEKTYLLVALAATAVVALGVPFVYEIVVDEVYDKKDVEQLGSEGFLLTASK